MRRRVLQATIAAVTVAVVLLGYPLAFLGAQYARDNELQKLDTRASQLAATIDFRDSRAILMTSRMLEPFAGGANTLPASVLVVQPQGTRLHAGDPIAGKSLSAEATAGTGALVILTVSWWSVFWISARVVVLVVAAAFIAFGAGIAMAMWQANRLAAPLVYLAASAEQLGSGQVRPSLDPSGVEEIDLVAA